MDKLKKNLSFKTFILIFFTLVFTCSLIYSLVLIYTPKIYQTNVTLEFNKDFDNLAEIIDLDNINDYIPIIEQFCNENNTSVIVVDNNTNIIYEWGEIYSVYKVSVEAIDERVVTSSSIVASLKNNSEHFLMTTGITNQTNQIIDVLRKLLPIIGGVIIAFSAVIAFVCSRFVSRPIIEISNISEGMANLDFTQKCKTNRTDEIGILANNLNLMSENLDNAITELNDANRLLKEDYDKEVKREQQRKDFFNAVSHELKTPITLLKNDLEGMIFQVGKYKDRDYYLNHANEMTNTLRDLVDEILTLSKLEENSLKRENVNIGAVVNSCCLMYEKLAVTKDIEFNYDIEDNIYFNVEKPLIKKAVSNIINNAILHSPNGEKVDVFFVSCDYGAVLRVINTGVKIDEEDIKEIFTPFYRAEKSRNRHTGGSGLGLYIVKSILKLHNFDYRIENIKNGVCFTIEFNK